MLVSREALVAFGWRAGSIALAMLLSLCVVGADARAESCLPHPKGQADPGHHWSYRIDRANRHCWYQKKVERAAPANTASVAAAPQSIADLPKPITWETWKAYMLGMLTPSAPASAATATSSSAPSAPAPQRLASAPASNATEGAKPAEPPAAPRPRAKHTRKRTEPTRVAAHKRAVQTPSDAGEPAALPFDSEKREGLFREFLNWKRRNTVCSVMNSTCEDEAK
jgi:hypothetical protein